MKTQLKKNAATGLVVLLISAACLAAVFIPSLAAASIPANATDRQVQHMSVLGIWQSPQMVHRLGLTEEQVRQLRDADFNARARQLELRGQLSSFRLQLEKAMAADIFDDKAIVKMAKKIANLNGELFVHKIESNLAVGNILNADQVAELKRLTGLHNK